MNKTEEEVFLENYHIEDYDRPSVTVDIATFCATSEKEESYRKDKEKHLGILLVKRKNPPFKDYWALPGGFLTKGETIEQCAFREIKQETGVKPKALMNMGTFSEDGRDPRGWIISNAFLSVLSGEAKKTTAGEDASEAEWFNISFTKNGSNYSLILENENTTLKATLKETKTIFGRSEFEIKKSDGIAFDHAMIIGTAISILRNIGTNFDILFDFLPKKFTLTELQRIQESLLDEEILPANFRRKVKDYVEETGEKTSGAGHRPAKLFTRKIQ